MRILIVDDSRSIRTGLRKKLEENGYEVFEAVNGQDSVAKAKEIKPHLITMDVDMPEMNGFQATAEIRSCKEGKHIPIIFFTGKDSIEDREQGFYLGATEFISKTSSAPWQEVVMTANRMLRCSSLPEGFTALVVDDNEVTKMIISNILRRQGIEVIEAASGPEALQIVAQKRTDIDLIITDYMMPEMNGSELCAQLRSRMGLRHTPIIFVSGATERGMILNMFQAGATDYIMKPFVKEELLARIRVHMSQWELIKELNSNVEQLEHLNKLRDEFVAMATHDLKNPLNGIMGFSQILEREDSLSQRHQKMITTIKDSSTLMLEIVNDILSLSRLESQNNEGTLTPLSLLPIIHIATASVQQTAFKKGVVLETVNNGQCDAIIDGNRNSLQRIMNNLLSNAIKFTPTEGKVNITLQPIKNKKINLTITDTGIGIPAAILPQLFEKFTKAARRGTDDEPGTGLGLAITKHLVEQQNGTIEVTSKEGEGSCFLLTFPITNTLP